MCGIAGYLSKAGTEAPVGRVLLDMLTGLARRGPDSAGLACFSGSSDGTSVAWVRLPTGADHEAAADTVRDRLTGLAEVRDVERHGDLVRLRLWLDGDRGARDLTRALERPGEDFEVVSVGEHLELVKQVGRAERARGDLRRRGDARQPRHRAHPAVDREQGGPVALPAVLGARRRGPRDGPQRPHHELRPAAPDLRAAGRPLLHRERLRGDRRLPRRPAVAGRHAGAGARELARRPRRQRSRTSSRRRTPSATPATRSRSSRSSRSRPSGYVAIANEEIAIRARARATTGVAHEPTGHVYRLWQVGPAATVGAAA